MVRAKFISFFLTTILFCKKLIGPGSNLVCTFAASDGHRFIETQAPTAPVDDREYVDRKTWFVSFGGLVPSLLLATGRTAHKRTKSEQ